VPTRRPPREPRGRDAERAQLDHLLTEARTGLSGALVLRGEAGIGKTALLEYAVQRSEGCRVTRAVGVESEVEWLFAALHQLCMPLLDGLERLPHPQRDALQRAFGQSSGPRPDCFAVGLAVLSLLSDAAKTQPLLCVVDDAQWLDRSSAQVLSLVARRLQAGSVIILFASRDEDEPDELAGLPELRLERLSYADARALFASASIEPLDERVRDRIIAEARGNPLALLELPRGRPAGRLAGGFALPDGSPLPRRIEASYRSRVMELPTETQRLLLVAAAEPTGDPTLLWRAAAELRIPIEAVAPAEADDLIEVGARVAFCHPVLRSAIYCAASPEERRGAHAVLAGVTDPGVDPDWRAWHRAHAALGPDEEVAAELELSAARAQTRGGLAAAAAFLEEAAGLTPDPVRRAHRALAAAQAKHLAGASDAAVGLLATAQRGELDELGRARVELLRAQIAHWQDHGSDAPRLLLRAAKRLEPLDVVLARETYLDALAAAQFAGRLARDGGVREVAQAALAAPGPSHPPRPADLLLDGIATLITDGYDAGVPMVKRALDAFCSEEISDEEAIRWSGLACRTAIDIWDFGSWDLLSGRLVALARDSGALAMLPLALIMRLGAHLYAGELAAVRSVHEEVESINEAIGSHRARYGALLPLAWRGSEAEAAGLIERALCDVTTGGEGQALAFIQYVRAVRYNGLSRHAEALAAAKLACECDEDLVLCNWSLAELVEAATRCGDVAAAADALGRLAQITRPSATDWALGVEACSRALVSEGEVAERLYREAIERLTRSRVWVVLARAHLLYGEWLRRERRRVDAREQLRTAHEMFTRMGAENFAQRAERELLATGERARKRTVETREDLTAQEAQVAQLARDGHSNPAIGGRLFISPRTVEYHLARVFGKLNISSRNQLDRVLPRDRSASQAV
jgi:DNA-binding CsgD family transcriptional regulator